MPGQKGTPRFSSYRLLSRRIANRARIIRMEMPGDNKGSCSPDALTGRSVKMTSRRRVTVQAHHCLRRQRKIFLLLLGEGGPEGRMRGMGARIVGKTFPSPCPLPRGEGKHLNGYEGAFCWIPPQANVGVLRWNGLGHRPSWPPDHETPLRLP